MKKKKICLSTNVMKNKVNGQPGENIFNTWQRANIPIYIEILEIIMNGINNKIGNGCEYQLTEETQ